MKNFKKVMPAMITVSLCLIAAQPAFAATSQKSDVTIEFEANNEPTNPVNPDNPGEESGNTGTGAAGPLSIDYVSPLSFGTGLAISSTQKTYNTVTAKPYLQATDNRGSGSGWKVTAALSRFRQDDVDTLLGSYITMINGSPLSVNPALTPPTAEQNIVLHTDSSSALILTAQKGAGMGTWVNRWYPATGVNNYVTLTVPGGVATTGTHTAVITWTLYDAP